MFLDLLGRPECTGGTLIDRFDGEGPTYREWMELKMNIRDIAPCNPLHIQKGGADPIRNLKYRKHIRKVRYHLNAPHIDTNNLNTPDDISIIDSDCHFDSSIWTGEYSDGSSVRFIQVPDSKNSDAYSPPVCELQESVAVEFNFACGVSSDQDVTCHVPIRIYLREHVEGGPLITDDSRGEISLFRANGYYYLAFTAQPSYGERPVAIELEGFPATTASFRQGKESLGEVYDKKVFSPKIFVLQVSPSDESVTVWTMGEEEGCFFTPQFINDRELLCLEYDGPPIGLTACFNRHMFINKLTFGDNSTIMKVVRISEKRPYSWLRTIPSDIHDPQSEPKIFCCLHDSGTHSGILEVVRIRKVGNTYREHPYGVSINDSRSCNLHVLDFTNQVDVCGDVCDDIVAFAFTEYEEMHLAVRVEVIGSIKSVTQRGPLVPMHFTWPGSRHLRENATYPLGCILLAATQRGGRMYLAIYDPVRRMCRLHFYDMSCYNEHLIGKTKWGETRCVKLALRKTEQSFRIEVFGQPLHFVQFATAVLDSVETRAVVFIAHGGPHGQQSVELFHKPIHEVLVRRGCVVVFVNYSGSTHETQASIENSIGTDGIKQAYECIAVMKHILQKYELPPNRCAIMGGSHGGFLSCLVANEWPDIGAAIIMNPVTDFLFSVKASDIPDWAVVTNAGSEWKSAAAGVSAGSITSDPKFPSFKESATRLEPTHVRCPCLMILGYEDRRCPYQQGKRWMESLRARSETPTKLLVYPNVGHALKLPDPFIWLDVEVSREIIHWVDTHLL